MFAGPNGSGKSTIKKSLPSELLGYYLNPDELEKEINETSRLELRNRGIQTDQQTLAYFLNQSVLAHKDYSDEELKLIVVRDASVDFSQTRISPYIASAMTELVRKELLRIGTSFTFETVMSHVEKV